MITTDHQGHRVEVRVFGEFTLADYKEFEEMVGVTLKEGGQVNLLVDLRDMAAATVDVAWEDIKFVRAHAHDFDRIAILASSQWVAWSAWLNKLFVDADVDLFDDETEAREWLANDGSAPV